MHVLIITPGFPQNDNDAECIPPMQEFLRELIKSYPEITVSAVAIHYPYKKSRYNWDGIDVFACGGNSSRQPWRTLYWIRAIFYSLQINKKNKIDLVHSFWLNENAFVGNAVSKLLKVKHINTMMGQDAKAGNKFYKLINLKNIFKVALTEYQADFFREACKLEPDMIIPWGLKSFEAGNHLRSIDILGAGSLIPLKNFQLFIEIVVEVKKEFPGIKCAIIGDGEEKGVLRKKIFENNLTDTILMKGQLPRESVLSDMKRSKIFLHTSNYESFGFVIAEALAAGCYLVSKKVGCAVPSEKLFVAEEIEDFKKIICNLLKSRKEFRASNIFPVQETAKAYADVYFKLVE